MTIRRIYVRKNDKQETNIRTETVYLLEGEIDLYGIVSIFFNPAHEDASLISGLRDADGPARHGKPGVAGGLIFEIRYKKSVVDPELNSLRAAARALGEDNLEWGRIGKRYQFMGLSEERAKKIVEENFFNPTVQEIVDPNETLLTLRPTGTPDPVRFISLKDLSDGELMHLSKNHSWNAPVFQLRAVQKHELDRGRLFTDAELELIFGSWSDHCYHTTWRGLGLLQRLKEATAKISHPRVVSAFDDNAGGIDFDGETVIIIKGETHNHPFAIEPKGAIETKHGGVIRDVIGFGKGGYPIGGTTIIGTATRDANPDECIDPERLVREAIGATASYCNPMGIPILHALYKKHPNYAKPFALGHCIGIIPKKYALKDDPQPEDIALLIGGKTGRDGIHGATASSGEITGKSRGKDFATVQIGDPITERRFMEAVPRLRDNDCIRSITDLGAMGIAGACGEMGAKTGIRINLNKVPLKDTSLTAWEILVSESQERMLLVIPPEKLRKAKRILRRYGVEYAAIGKFTNRKKFEAFWCSPTLNGAGQSKKVADIDMSFLWGACPIEKLPVIRPVLKVARAFDKKKKPADVGNPTSHIETEALLQFDKTVQGRTAIEPLAGERPTHISVLAPTRGNMGIVTVVSYHPEWADLHPKKYVELIFEDAVSRIIKAGANPRNIFLCSNFYTPNQSLRPAPSDAGLRSGTGQAPKPAPEINWHLKEMVFRLAELTEKYRIPVITGKDSSSGTFIANDGERIDAPPTFVLLALGIIDDLEKMRLTP